MNKHEELIRVNAAKAFSVSEDKVIVVEKLLGGMSHLTYKIKINNTFYTFRIIGKGGNLFVNRVLEEENMKLIKPLNINNETVYFDTVSGMKAAKYIEGTVLTQTDYQLYLDKIVKTLKILHNSGIEPANDYDLINRINLYESYNEKVSPLYLELKKKWLDLYVNCYQVNKKVFCHNDAQRSNMVITDNDKLYLLDWEYAGLNEFYYDIASFGNVDFNDALNLLDAYLGRKATKKEADHVRFYRMYQALQWHQVATYKDKIGLSKDVNFDFKMLANKYLNLAKALYEEIDK